jgi:hypothetical protein
MRLCWADKIPLALFGIITLVMLFLGLGAHPDMSEYCRSMRLEHPTWTYDDSYCFVTAAQHWSAFAWIEGFLFLKFVLPVWVVTRVIDLFGSGPALRRANRERHAADGPGHFPADIDLAPNEWTLSDPEWRRRLRSQG